mgnify:CR=1 FL=1
MIQRDGTWSVGAGVVNGSPSVVVLFKPANDGRDEEVHPFTDVDADELAKLLRRSAKYLRRHGADMMRDIRPGTSARSGLDESVVADCVRVGAEDHDVQ